MHCFKISNNSHNNSRIVESLLLPPSFPSSFPSPFPSSFPSPSPSFTHIRFCFLLCVPVWVTKSNKRYKIAWRGNEDTFILSLPLLYPSLLQDPAKRNETHISIFMFNMK